MMITREYHPVASVPQALPVTVTVAVNFVQFDSRNPSMSMRASFAQVRIESDTFAGQPVWKVTGEASKDQWWHVTLNKEDGPELAGLIAQARTAAHGL
ncbi:MULTISPECIES: hypothetical protein [Pseudomonas]|uniref:hypothetical protein n=1 Tax=Pseudomonas TaxID=286 RepID=UPI000E323F07|nr:MULTISPECIES: hypothetical protein [Pseudomonas]MCH5654038.1 hypothetical protein [Pseudomonas syringae]MDA7014121.1 hypothetical protein [Pseudomonas cerasi]